MTERKEHTDNTKQDSLTIDMTKSANGLSVRDVLTGLQLTAKATAHGLIAPVEMLAVGDFYNNLNKAMKDSTGYTYEELMAHSSKQNNKE